MAFHDLLFEGEYFRFGYAARDGDPMDVFSQISG